MSKFPKFDKQETKEGNIRRFVAKCLERMKHDNVRPCEDEKIEDIIKILSEFLSEKEAKDLLSIANYDKILGKDEEADFLELRSKLFELSEKTSDYEKFLKSFYYDVLPTVLIADFHGFGKVRNDFLRYFILWDNFADKKKMIIGWIPKYSFEASKKINSEKLDKLNDIKAFYEFAAKEIAFLIYDQPTTLCFYNVFRGLFNNLDFFKAVIEEKMLQPEDVLDIFSFHPDLFKVLDIFGMPNNEKFEFDVFDRETKLKYAEILFSWEEMTNYLAKKVSGFGIGIDEFRNRGFFSFMMKLDPEYRKPIKRRVFKINLRNLEELRDACDLFVNFGEILLGQLGRCCNGEAAESQEERVEYLKEFLEEWVLGKWYFTELPELFQKIVLVLHTLDFCGKSADFSEVGIDKDALKKEIDTFLGELKKIAASGGKPSDYYENKPFESFNIPNVESYISTQAFHAAVSFLRECFGAWKAVKPMLAIFRNLKEQAYSIDMEHYEYDRYTWAFVPVRITPLLGSLESEEAAKVCEEWFKHLAGLLKSADDFAINKRKENPEDVPEEFKEGYDITVIEPHPLWREAFCEAAGDLRVNLGCKSVFNHLKKNDIDKDVREAAAKTLERIEKIKGKFDSGSRKRALLNAWWWYRVAHLKSLGINFDWVSAQNLKSKEVKINYPKV
ncbi:hypothetical protein IJG44_04560 [bacterium]|nr:hypothetical protein [bacterium]